MIDEPLHVGPGQSDADLVDRVRRRDPAALGELYRRHAPFVMGSARRLCGAAKADDVTQDVFLRLWSRPDGYDGERGTLRAYLHMQVRSRSIDVLRHDYARGDRERAVGQERHSDFLDVAEAVVARHQAAQLEEQMTHLPPPQRDAIALAFFGACTYREVARLLDEPEGTVKIRIRAGLASLRKMQVDDYSLSMPR